jgi:hypothetical protein
MELQLSQFRSTDFLGRMNTGRPLGRVAKQVTARSERSFDRWETFQEPLIFSIILISLLSNVGYTLASKHGPRVKARWAATIL